MTTGTKIRLLREKKRLSQEELGYLVGVSQVTIGNWEHGKSIRHEYLKKLSTALEIQMEYLLEEEKNSTQANRNTEITASEKGFEIIIKAPNNFFEDLNRKMDFIITKFGESKWLSGIIIYKSIPNAASGFFMQKNQIIDQR